MLAKRYEAKEAEKKWQAFWVRESIYCFNPKSKKPIFSCDTPPPTVSGAMHLGHALAYSQADFVMRFKRMQGFNIFYPWGFDDNGLATERFVEEKCNVKSEDFPRKEFVKLCLKETKDVEKKLKEDWASLGISPDWNINYRTIDPWVQKASQRSFIEIYKKGREYQKEAPTIWCPKCHTAIAQVELKDKEFSTFLNDIVFKVDGKDLVISTTRPELLSSCVAVFYHPDDKRYQRYKDKKAVVPLFNFKVPIMPDKRADPSKGTGIVMCCDFGDLTDVEWYLIYRLPLRISITREGKMNERTGKYKGLTINEARQAIIQDLKDANLLVKQKQITHIINVHERCETPIEFMVTKQWFIKYLDLKKKFLGAGKKLNWHPKYMRIRYDNWVEGLQWDWCISRQRYYGIPFPVWYCKKCGSVTLAEDKDLPVDPLEDSPKKPCKCGSKDFEPEKDVLDTWATSSLTPMIPTKWKEDKKYFNRLFPMSLRSNGHDIITFWLFNTVVKSLLHKNKLPWKDVMINGFVLDPKGRKMSKSKGNVVKPLEVLEKYGADCLRFWAASTKLGEDVPYKEKELVSGRRMITKLWNAARFSTFHFKNYNLKKPKNLELVDKWILSKLQNLIKKSTNSFNRYEYSVTKSETEQFFWHDFCDNYLEIVKDRLYNKKRKKEEKESARYTLYSSLLTILKLFAPIMPHITEEIYQEMPGKKEKSIHISKFPEVNKKLYDKKAEKIGNVFVEILSKVRKERASKQKSLKAEIILTLEKNKLKVLEPVLEDLKAVTQAREIKEGNFSVKFL